MADNVLKVSITADGKQFNKTLDELQAQLQRFESGLKNSGNPESFNRINRAIDQTKQKIAALSGVKALDDIVPPATVEDVNKVNKALDDTKKKVTDLTNTKEPFQKIAPPAVVDSLNKINKSLDDTRQKITILGNTKDPLQKVSQSSNAATQSLINVGRVAQDLPFGFIGIANNLNPLLESFQRLKAESGSTSTAFKSLVSGLAGPAGIGVALSVVSSLLISFGSALFGTKAASEASEKALADFGDTIDSIKDGVAGLNTQLAFLNQLGSINIKINGLGALTDLQEQSIAQRQQTTALEAQRDKLNALGKKIVADADLNSKDRASAISKNEDAVKEINKDIADSERKQTILYRQIALQRVDDAKEANEKQKKESDKFISETIAKAKEFAAFFDKFTIRQFDFDIDPRDSLQETFKKALDFIAKTEGPRKNFVFKLNALAKIDVDSPELFKNLPAETQEIAKKTEKLIADLASRNPIVLAVELKQLQLRNAQRRLLALSQDLVNSIKNTVGNAFVSLAETIGGAFSGIDLGGQIFDIIGDLISQIGKALIQFGIVKLGLDKLLKSPLALSGGAAIALGAAAVAIGSLVKNIRVKGQRAVGGFVNSGDAYLVGERGPELFRPNVSGNIVANNAIAGARGTQMPMQISGLFRVQGNDLVAAIANTNRSQGRLN